MEKFANGTFGLGLGNGRGVEWLTTEPLRMASRIARISAWLGGVGLVVADLLLVSGDGLIGERMAIFSSASIISKWSEV